MEKYKQIAKETIADINSEVTLLSHQKSGARVLLISNDDDNKVFTIAFKTPVTNSKGLPHIIEHSVLCGSRKYPVKEPFVDIMKGSLNTFVNAFTALDKTMYPVASCNDKDFDNLCDIYMDAVFYPNMHHKEEIFLQEGWHYELPSVDDNVFINGVVYNEMKGAFSSPTTILNNEIMKTMFPDNCYGHNSGGAPDEIINLTYQEFKEFHQKYYHPANSYIVIYGNFDAQKKLDWLASEYLDNFDKVAVTSNIDYQKPNEKVLKSIVDFPITEEQDLNNKSYLSYNYFVGDVLDTKLWLTMNVLGYALIESPGAIVKETLTQKGLGSAVLASYNSDINQPIFSIISQNANAEQLDEFAKVIDETLEKIVANKIDKDLLLGAINYYEFSFREADYSGMPKGLFYIMSVLETWTYDDSQYTARLKQLSIFEELKSAVETGYFEEVIRKYLLNNNHKSLVAARPNKDLAAIKEQALSQKIKEYQDTLTIDDKKKLVEKTNALKAYQSSEDSKEDKATIPMLTREDLNVTPNQLSNNLEHVDDTLLIHHNVSTSGINYLTLLFDITGIANDVLPYLGILRDLFGKLSTKNYSIPALNNQINIHTGGIDFDILALEKGEDYKLYFEVSGKALYSETKVLIDMIYEIINNTVLTKYEDMLNILVEKYTQMNRYLNYRGHHCVLLRALSYISPSSYCSDQVSNIGYYKLLEQICLSEEYDMQELAANLTTLIKHIFRKDNLTISCTADIEGYKTIKEQLPLILKNTNGSKQKYPKFKFTANKLNEGFKTPFDVQFVALAGNYYSKGIRYNGYVKVLENILSTGYIWTNVRIKGGAYGGMCAFGRVNVVFTSYRDPNLSATLDVYRQIVDYLKAFVADDEEMTKAIIGTIGSVDRPLTPRMEGRRSLMSYLKDISYDDLVKERQEIVNCSDKDIINLVPLLEAVFKDEAICVIGNEKKIEENRQIFNNVINLIK